MLECTGGVGSAMVQLARLAGKEVIGLARSDARCRFIESLGATALDARDEHLTAAVLGATGGEGAGLVLDAAGGSGFMRLLDCVGPIHAVLPLQEAARAHAMLEAGTVLGKVVLQP